MTNPKRPVRRTAAIVLLAFGLAIVVEACSFETVFRAYLGKSLWQPTWRYVSELADGLPAEKADYQSYAGMSPGAGNSGLQNVRAAYRALFPDSGIGSLVWPDPVISNLRDLVRAASPANAAEADELRLLRCKVELRALKSWNDAALGQVRSCFESYLGQPRPAALASEASGWLARTEFLSGKGASAAKIYMSELASETSNIRRERLLSSLRMIHPREEELDEYFDTPAHALFAANQITSAEGPRALAGPLIKRLEEHEGLFRQGAESNALAITMMRAALEMGAPQSVLRYAERIPSNADTRQTAEYNWLVGTARFQGQDYLGAETAWMNVMNSKDGDLRQKAYAANGLIGVYARLKRPVDELWAAFQATSLSNAAAGGDRAQTFQVYPLYYYEMSRAGVYGYIGFDAPYLLDAELTDAELERSLKHPHMNPSDIDAIRYALAVRYARRERYLDAARIYDQRSSSRASLMREAAKLYAETKTPGIAADRRLKAMFDYADFLSNNEDGIFFNDTLWQGFQNGVLSGAVSLSDDSEGGAQLERRLRDDQEEYWRAYQILNRVVAQAGPTPLGKQAAERAIYCLRKIREDRFGRAQDISRADLRLSSWLERH
jgi:hypothetical protein